MDPAFLYDVLFLGAGWPGDSSFLPQHPASADWSAGGVGRGGGERLLYMWRIDAMEVDHGAVTLPLTVSTRWSGCRYHTGFEHQLALDRADAPRVAAGGGAMVEVAGFWTNGTLFYTNVEALHGSALPRASWYAWDDAGPLPVYVYDGSPAEQPAYWKGLQGTVGRPGSPLDDEAWAATGGVDAQAGIGYWPTIPGVNDALQGLPVGTSRVVFVQPADAYTRPGLEQHPLYGEELLFWLRVVAVHEWPCVRATGLTGCPLS